MNKILNYTAGVLAVVALIVGVIAFNKVPEKVVGEQGPQGERGVPGRDGTNADPIVGAVTGPDFYGPYWAVNGTKQYFTTKGFTTATTTVCAIRSPINATSTLVNGVADFVVSSTTASTVTVAKATTAFATTTLINSVSVGAGAQATILFASTTLSALEQTNKTFAPGTYLVVGMAGGVGTFSPTGTCRAEFRSAK